MPSHEKVKSERQYPSFPRVGIGALIFKDNRILLIKRGQEPSKGKWTVPGGLVELGERLSETVQREIYEECNIRIRVLDRLGIFEFIETDQQKDVRFHYIVIDYLADYVAGELKAGSDIDEARWVELDKTDELDITDSIKPLIQKAIAIRQGQSVPRK